jgi:predicted DNA-binding transcriptional regulator
VVVDLDRGRSVGLNATGGLVWGLLGEHEEEQIAAELARRFGIGEEKARADVARLLAALLDRGLVVEA